MGNISIEVTYPALPEGWAGTPQEFVQWLAENAEYSATGAFLTGQVGGARPTSDVGLFINGGILEVWDADLNQYQPIKTTEIGTVVDFPSAQSLPPENYLFCEGQLLLVATYPELYAVIARDWTGSPDPNDSFRIPDYRGRRSVGSGTGKYNPKNEPTGVLTGPLAEHPLGSYFGQEWATHDISVQPNAPTPRYSLARAGDESTQFVWNKSSYNSVIEPALAVRKIIRVK